ncbi:uncharacterized protein LOC108739371 [Agrilus planipennis]|uniref:Uncharacterized protein LOC108739371 n=1 Tax=Agrilus planipennis TaxID=224129 RepID=A0A1W4WY26_AGRPL|nr:uncharacterized protein LOC108739371 [Agrilus planipennis]
MKATTNRDRNFNRRLNVSGLNLTMTNKTKKRRSPSPVGSTQVAVSGSGEKHFPSSWPIYSLVSTVAVACYINGLNGDFVHDDIPAVTLNKDVLARNPLINVFKNDFWGTPMADLSSHKSYRPLTVLTFRANYQFFTLQPFWFHVTNMTLHVVACVLFTRVSLCVAGFKPPFATLAGLMFAIHPIHTEAPLIWTKHLFACPLSVRICGVVSPLFIAEVIVLSSLSSWWVRMVGQDQGPLPPQLKYLKLSSLNFQNRTGPHGTNDTLGSTTLFLPVNQYLSISTSTFFV